jgi:hypothetical protein
MLHEEHRFGQSMLLKTRGFNERKAVGGQVRALDAAHADPSARLYAVFH